MGATPVTVVHRVHWMTLLPWLVIFMLGFLLIAVTLFVTVTGRVAVADEIAVCRVVQESR